MAEYQKSIFDNNFNALKKLVALKEPEPVPEDTTIYKARLALQLEL